MFTRYVIQVSIPPCIQESCTAASSFQNTGDRDFDFGMSLLCACGVQTRDVGRGLFILQVSSRILVSIWCRMYPQNAFCMNSYAEKGQVSFNAL